MDKFYIILSLTHSTDKEPVYWRKDDAGYTMIPWSAGIYHEAQVKGNPGYYNNGDSTLAIPLTDMHLQKCGLKFTLDVKQLKAYIKEYHKKA